MNQPVYGIIGALEAFPRRLAAREVVRTGGRLTRGVTRQTSHVVLGRSLLGRLPEAEIAARVVEERAAGRTVLGESGFLQALGLLKPAELGLARTEIVARSGLAPATFDLLALFGAFERETEPFAFRDLVRARALAALLAGGASWAAAARARPPASARLELGARKALYARHGDRLSELDGQLLLGFEPEEADAAFGAAEQAEREGRLGEAARLYQRCLAADPGDAAAAYNRANCLRGLGEPGEAEHEYLRALQLDPGFSEAWFNLAGLMSERGRPDKARAYLEQAVARDPDYADAIYNLASLAFEAGDLAGAGQLWQRYVALDPDLDWGRLAARGLRYLAQRPAG